MVQCKFSIQVILPLIQRCMRSFVFIINNKKELALLRTVHKHTVQRHTSSLMYITSQNVHTFSIESKFIKYLSNFKRNEVEKKKQLLFRFILKCFRLHSFIPNVSLQIFTKWSTYVLYVTTKLKTFMDYL